MPVNLDNQHLLTDASTISRISSGRSYAGMAHFAGTGPILATCRECAFFHKPGRNGDAICEKFVELTSIKSKKVPGTASACRHFAEAKK